MDGGMGSLARRAPPACSPFHEDGRRRIVVSANTAGRDVGSVVKDIEAQLDARGFPEGVSWTLAGQLESQREASRPIALLSLLALVGL